MRQFIPFLPILDQGLPRQPDAFIICKPFLDPILMPHLPTPVGLRLARVAWFSRFCYAAVNGFDSFIRPDKEFELHLLEFAGAKGKIARIDLVPKCFANLANTKRHFLP